MGTKITQDITHGFVIPNERVGLDTIDDTESSFTQAGPEPGDAIPEMANTKMRIRTSGEQPADGDLQIVTARAGNPTPDGGGFTWYDPAGGDGPSDQSGWDCYNVITEWLPFAWSASSTPQPAPHALRLQSGKILVVGISDGSGHRKAYTYDPDSSVQGFDGGVNIGIQDNLTHRQSACVQLEDGTVVMMVETPDHVQVDVWESYDDGQTWTIRGHRVLDQPILDSGAAASPLYKLRAAYSLGQILMFVAYGDGGASGGAIHSMQQYASADQGATFQQVWNEAEGVYDPDVCPRPGGGFCVYLYDWNSIIFGGFVNTGVVLLGGAYTPITSGQGRPLNEDAAPLMSACIWLDESGTIYVMYPIKFDSDTKLGYKLEQSETGDAWNHYQMWSWMNESYNDWFVGQGIASTGGSAIMVTRFTSRVATPTNAYENHSVVGIRWGGASNHTLPDSTAAQLNWGFDETNALSYADDDGEFGRGNCWIPIAEPQYLGWTGSAGAATVALTASGDLDISAAVGQSDYWHDAYSSASEDKIMGEVACKVMSGGSQATDAISVMARLTDTSTWGIQAILRMDTTGIQVYDPVAAGNVGAAIPLTMTSFHRVRFAMGYNPGSGGSGTLQIWTREDVDGQRRVWVYQGEYDLDAGGSYPDSRMEWGHRVGAAVGGNQSRWRQAAYSYLASAWSEHTDYFSSFHTAWSNPGCLHPRPFPTAPMLLWDGLKIAVEGGPTVIGDEWSIATRYQHGIGNTDPRLQPSPRVTWRSTGDNQIEDICWDIDDLYTASTWERDAVGIFLLGCNFRRALIEGRSGGAGAYTQIAELLADDGYDGLKFERHGRIVRPDDSQVTTGERWIYSEEHRGDVFDLGSIAGGDPPGNRYTKIDHNESGAWRGSGVTTLRPSIVLDPDTMQGGEVSTGTGAIWRKNFGAIVSGLLNTHYDQIRLRIPAQQTADDYYEIGTIVIGHVTTLVVPPSHGTAHLHQVPHERIERPDGNFRSRTLGPVAREWTLSWADGVPATATNQDDPDPDYVAIGGNAGAYNPSGVKDDTLRSIVGTVRRVEGAHVPIVYLTAIEHQGPQGGIQLELRPRGFIFGRVVTDPKVERTLGVETQDEMEQLTSLRIREVT